MIGYMYILECSDGSYYTGSTKDLEKRIAQHQAGEGANHTKKHLPIKLVYFEKFQRIDEAFYREKQVQGWSRKKKEALIHNTPEKLHELAKCMNETTHVGFGFAQQTDDKQAMDSSQPTNGFDSAQPSADITNGFDSADITDAERSRSGSVEDKASAERSRSMPDGWMETVLDEVSKKITDGSHQSPKAYKGGKPMLSVKDMNTYGFNIENSKTISDKDYIKLSKQGCKPEINDILIAKDGSVLKHIFRVKKEIEVVLLSSIAIIKPKIDLINPDYLVYTLINPKFQKYILNNFLSGSGVPRIVLKDFKKIIFKLPLLEEQKAIAKVLTAFDDKIENLRAQNKTLEQTAQTIFAAWFGKYQIDDELPDGWRVGTIDDLVETIIDYRGKTPKKLGMDWSDNGIPALSAKTIKKGKIVRRDAMNFGSPELYKIWMKDELQKGDILLTSEAPLGEMYYINDETKFILSQRLFALRVNKKISSEYLYHYLFSKNGQHLLSARASGSTVQGIRQSELRKIEVIVPKEDIMEKASLIFRSSIEKKAINSKQIQTLTKSRDTLLPKLMSGAIRVNGFKK